MLEREGKNFKFFKIHRSYLKGFNTLFLRLRSYHVV